MLPGHAGEQPPRKLSPTEFCSRSAQECLPILPALRRMIFRRERSRLALIAPF